MQTELFQDIQRSQLNSSPSWGTKTQKKKKNSLTHIFCSELFILILFLSLSLHSSLQQAGCDHVLNSKARRDKCGVCGGDNSSCKTVAGTFNIVRYGELQFTSGAEESRASAAVHPSLTHAAAVAGYNEVVRIPSGATNIDVRQHSYSGKPEDDNYLGETPADPLSRPGGVVV